MRFRTHLLERVLQALLHILKSATSYETVNVLHALNTAITDNGAHCQKVSNYCGFISFTHHWYSIMMLYLLHFYH
jgi:hypothetical protein